MDTDRLRQIAEKIRRLTQTDIDLHQIKGLEQLADYEDCPTNEAGESAPSSDAPTSLVRESSAPSILPMSDAKKDRERQKQPPFPHIVLISQKVRDIKLPPNGALETHMGTLRSLLRERSFIPGDKVPAEITPTRVADGDVIANLSGRFLSSGPGTELHIAQHFPLGLQDYRGPMDVESLFSSVKGARVDDGGNIQNMIVNMALALVDCEEFRGKIHLTVASSSDPFARMPESVAARLRDVCKVYHLPLPDRICIHAPWERDGHSGTLAIASEPERTDRALEKLLETEPAFAKAFARATCFVSSDCIHRQLETAATPPYVELVNASTAFRSLVAAESYSRTVLLPMNNGEASDVCKLLLQRGLEVELEKIERPAFPPPLTTSGDEIDWEALQQLDESIDRFVSYIPLRNHSYTCPITFGADGGLLIGSGQNQIACFVSTPSLEGEKRLVEEFGNSDQIDWGRVHEVGAGDAAAVPIAFFNTIDPRVIIKPYLEGREPRNAELSDFASTLFVNLVARIAGAFLVRTVDTHWSNVRSGGFHSILIEAAREAVSVARGNVKRLSHPVLCEVKRWGMKVVVWRPGKVAFPNRRQLLATA